MAKIDKSYHELLNVIMKKGYVYEDPNRKGVNRIEIPSYTFRHEFKDGFPAVSTKKLHYKNVATELIWFLRGDTNIKYLVDNSCNIWNKDAYNYLKKNTEEGDCIPSSDWFISLIKEGNDSLGDLGPVYGHQWRSFNGVDQISKLIKDLKEKPLGTQHIVNSWNVGDLEDMALQPCHYGFQVVVRPLSFEERMVIANKSSTTLYRIKAGKISLTNLMNALSIPEYGFELHWQQRSVDTFLGLPYNIASYATLALILEKITGYKALGIQGDLKKVHLYNNSLDAVEEQLSRDINKFSKCELDISKVVDIDISKYWNNLDMFTKRLNTDDFKLEGYKSYPAINVKMLERDE